MHTGCTSWAKKPAVKKVVVARRTITEEPKDTRACLPPPWQSLTVDVVLGVDNAVAVVVAFKDATSAVGAAWSRGRDDGAANASASRRGRGSFVWYYRGDDEETERK